MTTKQITSILINHMIKYHVTNNDTVYAYDDGPGKYIKVSRWSLNKLKLWLGY